MHVLLRRDTDTLRLIEVDPKWDYLGYELVQFIAAWQGRLIAHAPVIHVDEAIVERRVLGEDIIHPDDFDIYQAEIWKALTPRLAEVIVRSWDHWTSEYSPKTRSVVEILRYEVLDRLKIWVEPPDGAPSSPPVEGLERYERPDPV